MSKPLFSIGETVIRQAPSTNYPEGNGEYVVCGITDAQDAKNLYSANWGGQAASTTSWMVFL